MTTRLDSLPAILHLQQTIGNQAVRQLLDGQANDRKKETLGDRLPQARGTPAARAIVLSASPLPDQCGANAVTLADSVHLSSTLDRLPANEQQRVLAHEAVHLAQRASSGLRASGPALEMEARKLTPDVLAGRVVQPVLHADAGTALADDGGPLPGDRIAVDRAKKRREVLLRFAEARSLRERRKRLDDSMAKTLGELERRSGQKGPSVEDYRDQERMRLNSLNTKPVTVELTSTAVRIRVRFQVRFEGMADKDAKAKFPILEKNLLKGIRDTWNRTLSKDVMGGRSLELIPELKLVAVNAQRDKNTWLITVRPTDTGPMVYEGQSLGTAPGGVPTSATDPMVDGGVMSIPPSHISLPETLGHESLHLFGLVDRYAILPAALSPTRTDEEVPLRSTQGRLDPLAAEGGQILEEDVGFVLSALEVYPNMSESEMQLELNHVDEIIRTGRDPNSLIRKRKTFDKEMVKQTEDLD